MITTPTFTQPNSQQPHHHSTLRFLPPTHPSTSLFTQKFFHPMYIVPLTPASRPQVLLTWPPKDFTTLQPYPPPRKDKPLAVRCEWTATYAWVVTSGCTCVSTRTFAMSPWTTRLQHGALALSFRELTLTTMQYVLLSQNRPKVRNTITVTFLKSLTIRGKKLKMYKYRKEIIRFTMFIEHWTTDISQWCAVKFINTWHFVSLTAQREISCVNSDCIRNNVFKLWYIITALSQNSQLWFQQQKVTKRKRKQNSYLLTSVLGIVTFHYTKICFVPQFTTLKLFFLISLY